MKKTRLYIFLAFAFILLIPFPGRFAFGLVEVVSVNLLLLFTILFRRLIKKLNMKNLEDIAFISFSVGFSVILQQLIKIAFPYIALTTGYVFYIPCVSSFFIGFAENYSELSLAEEMKCKFKSLLFLSIFALLFYLVRDILGYGTFTFPGHEGLIEFVIIPSSFNFSAGTFIASIPGALVLMTLVTIFFASAEKHFSLIEKENAIKSEENQNEKNEKSDFYEKNAEGENEK